MRQVLRALASAAVTAACLLSVPAGYAQAPSPSTGLSEPSPNIPDQKLDATAAAMTRVVSVQHDYQQRIAAAPPADRARVADEAKDALVKAVTDQGLSVEEYTSILKVAQSDPAVREKIFQRLDRSTNK